MTDSDVPGAWDCIVVGAGPAGLSAAVYCARFLRSALVLHDGKARALRIPLTHNVPGFPDGVSGTDLIARMTEHATSYGAVISEAKIISIGLRAEHGFVIEAEEGRRWYSRSVIMATGIDLNQIALPDDVHEAAIRLNVLRYCPVCDAYEHKGKRIAVVGCDVQGAAEALFLRTYSPDVTLIPHRYHELTEQEVAQLDEHGVVVAQAAVSGYEVHPDGMHITYSDGSHDKFDVVYPALGVTPRTELVETLGVPLDDNKCVASSSFVETNVPGLWCAGDIVDGLDQISVAMGHGAIAATKAHNWLRDRDEQTIQSQRATR